MFQKDLNSIMQNKINQLKAYVPWIIVVTEEFEKRLEAREREKYLKTGVGREFIKTLLNSQD